MRRQIKDLVLKKSRTVIQSVIFYNEEIKETKEITDKLNVYFVNNINEISSSIKKVQFVNLN